MYGGVTVMNEWAGILKEVAVTEFEVLSHHLPGDAENTCENPE
jgi:hypothetical protein